MQTRRWALRLILMLSLVVPTLGIADDGDTEKHSNNAEKSGGARSQLEKTLRASMSSYRNSPPEGYVPDPFCVSGVDGGAVGIHFVNFSLVDNVLNAAEPEVLYYEPRPGGKIRLVGAEYAYFAPAGQDTALLPFEPVHLDGHLLQYMVAPNRFAIPVDWLRLNVWAWRNNPNGTFAADNPRVSCDHYDPNEHPQPPPPPS